MRKHITHFELLLRIYLVLVFVVVLSSTKAYTVEDVVVKWAPLIWLAPGEKYHPLSVTEFLDNVYPAFDVGKPKETLPTGRSSEMIYLVTKKQIVDLRNGTSFLNGRNPVDNAVPIYATVTDCRPNHGMSLWQEQFALKNEISKYIEPDPKFYFHVTYWTFYPFNEGKEVCFLGKLPTPFFFNKCIGSKKTLGNHIGDWEHVSLMFNGKPYPDEMFVSTHDSGVYYKYEKNSRVFRYRKQVTLKGIVQKPKFPPILRTIAGRPVLFAALGSHGLWSAPGEHSYTRVLHLTDTTGYGKPWKTWLNISIYQTGYGKPPIWLDYLGRWGNPKSNCFLSKKLGICEFSDGPPGLLNRKQNFECAISGSPRSRIKRRTIEEIENLTLLD